MNELFSNRIAEIEAWFAAHEDGNFLVNPAANPSRIEGDPATARTILYLQKSYCHDRIQGLDDLPRPLAMVIRPGLPIAEDLELLRGSGKPARIYIGDGDPADLMCFAWLREHLTIQWGGVSDDFLRRHGNFLYNGIRIPMRAPDEYEEGDEQYELVSLPLLNRVCPDWRELLGPYCSLLLVSGFKIELEGAIMSRD